MVDRDLPVAVKTKWLLLSVGTGRDTYTTACILRTRNTNKARLRLAGAGGGTGVVILELTDLELQPHVFGSLYTGDRREPIILAFRSGNRQYPPPDTATLVDPICAKRFHRRYSGQSALPDRHYRGATTISL